MTFFVLTSIAVLCILVWLGVICWRQKQAFDDLNLKYLDAIAETIALECEIRRVAPQLQSDEREYEGKDRWNAVVQTALRDNETQHVSWSNDFEEHWKRLNSF